VRTGWQACKTEALLCVEGCEEGSRRDACQPGCAGIGQDVRYGHLGACYIEKTHSRNEGEHEQIDIRHPKPDCGLKDRPLYNSPLGLVPDAIVVTHRAVVTRKR
jgi:hypothetical protein